MAQKIVNNEDEAMPIENELIQAKLNDILRRCKKIDFSSALEKKDEIKIFEDVSLYIMNTALKDEILALEAWVIELHSMGDDNKESQSDYAGKALFDYAKIINRDFPAYKYSFSVAKVAVEIFDKDKVRDAIPGQIARWENIERLRLQENIDSRVPPLSPEEITHLKHQLDLRIEIDQKQMEAILENWENHDVVITTHEYCNTYPSIYLTMDLVHSENPIQREKQEQEFKKNKKATYKKKSSHLRNSAPNLLWFDDSRPFSALRANDKITRVLQTHTPLCGSIYIKKNEEI